MGDQVIAAVSGDRATCAGIELCDAFSRYCGNTWIETPKASDGYRTTTLHRTIADCWQELVWQSLVPGRLQLEVCRGSSCERRVVHPAAAPLLKVVDVIEGTLEEPDGTLLYGARIIEDAESCATDQSSTAAACATKLSSDQSERFISRSASAQHVYKNLLNEGQVWNPDTWAARANSVLKRMSEKHAELNMTQHAATQALRRYHDAHPEIPRPPAYDPKAKPSV